MNRHTQHYLDLNPERQVEPHPMRLVAGAFFTFGGLWLLAAFLFSL